MAAVPKPIPEEGADALEVRVTRRTDGTPAAVFFVLDWRCELLFDGVEAREAGDLARIAAEEVRRIGRKYASTGESSVVVNANRNPNKPIEVDEETARLVDVAVRAYARSGGRFDVTTGLLRRAWSFDGTDNVPKQDRIHALQAHVGLDRLGWDPPRLIVPLGIELDFGALLKRYAVDRIGDVLSPLSDASVLVDVGGDLGVNRSPEGAPWRVRVHRAVGGNVPPVFEMRGGALATSGDSRRFMLKNGVRYGDLLDPRTGWPIPDAPRLVSVAASTCVDAGVLATTARLHGPDAGSFLDEVGATHWIVSR